MITVQTQDAIAIITIDRDEKRNALDIAHLEQLGKSVEACISDSHRALVITGAGRAFSAGADLGGVYGDGFRDALYATLHTITTAPVPVIAAVNGAAIGAGTQLAIACDLRVSAPNAVYAVPTARNGLAVDPWTIRRLSVLGGGGTARALLLACETIDAETAQNRGLVDSIGTTADAVEIAREIATFAPLSLQYSKHALNALLEPDEWDDSLGFEFDRCWSSADFAESQIARSENRRPIFEGK
ncbi:enoyl-CoA hydratase [Rhodococcus sp. IEGM 1307]|uniref:enoyl-CoA hydratase n=1 Tax=Rhodococcus sp. IEGM 1307 TaxID=3047091 RepID=UPI0024B8386F|nr:enoyl-CoA hydratase [Rhodococcus sp. IEGM 1307]MDI9978863.1 enoyl-CoA hydratase [Rhodococcus sp. IEGM 1307]